MARRRATCLQEAIRRQRFVASEEANVPRAYKERIVAAAADETVYSELFDIGWPNAPHRTLKNKIVEEWEAAGRPPAGKRPGEGTPIGKVVRGETTIDVPKYGAAMLTADFKGDPDYAPLSRKLVTSPFGQ